MLIYKHLHLINAYSMKRIDIDRLELPKMRDDALIACERARNKKDAKIALYLKGYADGIEDVMLRVGVTNSNPDVSLK